MKYVYDYSKIGERIKDERKKNGLTQDELINSLRDKQIAVGRNTLSAMENGIKEKFSFQVLYGLAEIFQCQIGYLLCEYDCKIQSNAAISEITGLSDNAINTLKKVNENKDEYRRYEVLHLIDTLNLIMDEPISFMLFLDHIGDYIDNKYTIPLHYDSEINDYTESISEPPRLSLVDVPRKEKERYIVLGAPNNNPDNPEKYIHRQIPVSFAETYHIDTIRKVLDVWKKEYEKKNNKQKDGD
ncbi:MAG: helix-turn-helix domain-containing protein [Lacrimispora saccharolytica]